MPTINNNAGNGDSRDNAIIQTQLLAPNPLPVRGRPFPLSLHEGWLVYPHGKCIYLYNLSDPKATIELRGHNQAVTATKFSSFGGFLASGDSAGNLKIWKLGLESGGDDGIFVVLESGALGGPIRDIVWSQNEKFIAVCGEGRDRFAQILRVEDGKVFGELSGPGKPCTSLAFIGDDYLVVGSDDFCLYLYGNSDTTTTQAGRKHQPFKFIRTLPHRHRNFVQCVRACGDGRILSAGADGQVLIFSPSEGTDTLIEGGKWHETGILAAEWLNPNQIITATADGKLCIWNLGSPGQDKQIKWQQEPQQEQQQCPSARFNQAITGVALNREKNFLMALRLTGALERFEIVDGRFELQENSLTSVSHSKGISDICSSDHCNIHSLSHDGQIKNWNWSNNLLTEVSNQQTDIVAGQKLIGGDHGIICENRFIQPHSGSIREFSSKILAVSHQETEGSASTFLLQNSQIISFNEEEEKTVGKKLDFATESHSESFLAQFSANGLLFVISKDSKLHVFNQDYKHLSVFSSSISTGKPACLAINPLGNLVACADDQRRINVFSFEETRGLQKISTQWCHHSARIDCLLWLDGERIVSGGVDGHLMLWNPKTSPLRPLKEFKAAHATPITALAKLGHDSTGTHFISGALDGTMRIWRVL